MPEQNMIPSCPFCGKTVDLEDNDVLYPSGVVWRTLREDGVFRSYHTMDERKDGDQFCYSMNCPTPSGGCGANITADSKEEALAAWTRRPTSTQTGLVDDRSLHSVLTELDQHLPFDWAFDSVRECFGRNDFREAVAAFRVALAALQPSAPAPTTKG